MGNQLSNKTNTRVEYLDIAKGIGIILVVWAHASGPYSRYINQFHMPMFFLISGLLYNNKVPVLQYVKRKFLHLYIPFVFWNLLSFIAKTIYVGFEPKQFFGETFRIVLTLSKEGQFFGATWFLGALFVVTILYRVLDYALRKTAFGMWILLGVATVIACVGFSINFPWLLSRTMILTFFFAFGVVCRKYENCFESMKVGYKYATAIVMLAVFAVIGHFNDAIMRTNEYTSPLLFIVGSVCMSYAVICASYLFGQIEFIIIVYMRRLLTFLGRESLGIVLWQFVFFRPIIILQILLAGKDLTIARILAYYPTYDSSGGWWIVYTLAGIILPILWCYLLRMKPWGKLFAKMHIV